MSTSTSRKPGRDGWRTTRSRTVSYHEERNAKFDCIDFWISCLKLIFGNREQYQPALAAVTLSSVMRTRSAFTLLELLLVIGILSVIAALNLPLYYRFQIRSDLDLVNSQAVQGLARARLLSQTGQRDSAWGFYVPNGTLYKGQSYATRDANFDERYPMPSTISVSGLLDVAYTKITGIPTKTGSIVLTALTNDQRIIPITINVSRQQIATAALSSWSSSLPPSSSSTSYADQCPTKFHLNNGKLIFNTASTDITVTNMESLITFGEGGPPVSAFVCKTTDGKKWSPLFSGKGSCTGTGKNNYGAAVSRTGGESAQLTVPAGQKFGILVNGQYINSGYLAFFQTFSTGDDKDHILLLQKDDTVPNYPSYNGNPGLRAYLASKGMMNGSKLWTDPCNVLVFAELGSLDQPSANFQDEVLMLTFE